MLDLIDRECMTLNRMAPTVALPPGEREHFFPKGGLRHQHSTSVLAAAQASLACSGDGMPPRLVAAAFPRVMGGGEDAVAAVVDGRNGGCGGGGGGGGSGRRRAVVAAAAAG